MGSAILKVPKKGRRTIAGKKLRSIRNHVFRYARALDVARWNFHFEDGSEKDVLKALAVYRNADGGFGHGLEPDLHDPESTPTGAWVDVRVLREIGFPEIAENLMRDLYDYLLPLPPFHTETDEIAQTVRSYYNEAPCHPTAELAGFILRTAEEGSVAKKHAEEVLKNLLPRVARQHPKGIDLSTLAALSEDLEAAGRNDLLPEGFHKWIGDQVYQSIEQNPSKYEQGGHLITPKYYIAGKDSPYYERNRAICDFYAGHLEDTVTNSGAWDIGRSAGKEERAHQAKRDWQGSLIVDNMLYLQGMK